MRLKIGYGYRPHRIRVFIDDHIKEAIEQIAKTMQFADGNTKNKEDGVRLTDSSAAYILMKAGAEALDQNPASLEVIRHLMSYQRSAGQDADQMARIILNTPANTVVLDIIADILEKEPKVVSEIARQVVDKHRDDMAASLVSALRGKKEP